MVLSRQTAERVWQGHGSAMHMLACAFLGDSSRADLAVAQGICDFAGRPEHVRPRDEIAARRELARIVYRLCGEVVTRPSAPAKPAALPPLMVWLAEVSVRQRTCLVLCLFDGHTYREAAHLLGLAPTDVASLLRTGLLDLAGATGQPATASTRSN